jgi:hypothetical protein
MSLQSPAHVLLKRHERGVSGDNFKTKNPPQRGFFDILLFGAHPSFFAILATFTVYHLGDRVTNSSYIS